MHRRENRDGLPSGMKVKTPVHGNNLEGDDTVAGEAMKRHATVGGSIHTMMRIFSAAGWCERRDPNHPSQTRGLKHVERKRVCLEPIATPCPLCPRTTGAWLKSKHFAFEDPPKECDFHARIQLATITMKET